MIAMSQFIWDLLSSSLKENKGLYYGLVVKIKWQHVKPLLAAKIVDPHYALLPYLWLLLAKIHL